MQLHHLVALLAGLAASTTAIPLSDTPTIDSALEARAEANELYDRQIVPEELDGLYTRSNIERDFDAPLSRRAAEAESDETSHLSKRFLAGNGFYDNDWRYQQNGRVVWRKGRRYFRNRNVFFDDDDDLVWVNGRRRRFGNNLNYSYDWNVGRRFW